MQQSVKISRKINDTHTDESVVRDLSEYLEQSLIVDQSESMQEILSRKPGFVENWSLLMFLSILLIILVATWFIRYPDMVEANGILTSSDAPKEIITPKGGRIKQLFAVNESMVTEGQTIARMESIADYSSITILKQQLDSAQVQVDAGKTFDAANCFRRSLSNLGELQRDYESFIAALQFFNSHSDNGYYTQRLKMLQTDLMYLKEEERNIQAERELANQGFSIARETFEMNKKLREMNAESEDEFRHASSTFIDRKIDLEKYNATLLSNRTRKHNKLKEIAELTHEISKQSTDFVQSFNILSSAMENWMYHYILKAPASGQLTYMLPVQKNQHVPSGSCIAVISSVSNSQIVVDAYLRQYSFGKIDTGMQANLQFDAYPHQEFGYVQGTLEYISPVPSDSGFLATIRLNNGLVTTRDVRILYKPGLKMRVKIVTRDLRLLERLYYNLLK